MSFWWNPNDPTSPSGWTPNNTPGWWTQNQFYSWLSANHPNLFQLSPTWNNISSGFFPTSPYYQTPYQTTMSTITPKPYPFFNALASSYSPFGTTNILSRFTRREPYFSRQPRYIPSRPVTQPKRATRPTTTTFPEQKIGKNKWVWIYNPKTKQKRKWGVAIWDEKTKQYLQEGLLPPGWRIWHGK